MNVEVLVRPDKAMTHGFFKFSHAKTKPKIVQCYGYDGFLFKWSCMAVSLSDGDCVLMLIVAEGSRGEPFFRMILIFKPTASHSTLAKGTKSYPRKEFTARSFFWCDLRGIMFGSALVTGRQTTLEKWRVTGRICART